MTIDTTSKTLAPDESLHTVENLAAFDDAQDAYQFVASALYRYTGAVIAGFALCEDGRLLGTIQAVQSIPQIMTSAENVIGRSLIGSPIAIPPALRKPSTLNVISWEKDIYPRVAQGPQGAPFANIGIAFGLGLVYGFPFYYDGKLKAVTGMVFAQGQVPRPDELERVEQFLRHAVIALRPFLAAPGKGTMMVGEVPLEDEYSSVFSQSDAAVILLERGRVVDCNPRAGLLLGVSPEALQGGLIVAALTHLNISPTDHLRASLELAEQNQVQTIELSLDHPRFGRRLLEIRLLPLTLPAGRHMVQMTAQDVTERRQMEEALRESEARYRELFETSHDGIVIADHDGRLLDCNQAFIELMGYDDVNQLRGLHFSDVTPEEFHERDMQMKTLLNKENFVEYEKEYFRRSGDRVLVWERIWNRRNAKGTFIGSWALIRDITTARQVESDISAIEKFRLLGELAAAISHEIRNPLTTVRGFLQLLSSRPTCSGEDQEFFQLMISEIDSATTIIKDFLDLARPIGPKRENISLSDLLTSLARIMESKAIMQKVEIKTQIEPGVEIIGDPSQLRQVYVNLLQNAFQAMSNGGVLTITVGREEDTAVVTIGDTGVGIPADHLERIGRPFFTTRPGGTGLGLTTCYRIVSSHVGKIKVASEVGVGTTFSVHLPCPSSV